jgi:outer membrane protein OmpA-like peptidoglycan-associated protein
VTIDGTQDDGTPLSRTLTNRTNNRWTEENLRPGRVTATASVAEPEAMAGSAQGTIRAGQTARVQITLQPESVVAHAFIVHFWFDSAFVEPAMFAVLKRAGKYASAHPDEKLVIVGHTDKVGSAEYNQSLSERRSRAVHAALTAEAAEWDILRRPATGALPSVRDTWDTREYQFMLQALGFYRGNVDGQHGPQTSAAVKAFRESKGLPAGTTVDDAVWAALIQDYLGQGVPAIGADRLLPNCPGQPLAWLGCGEQDPVKNTEAAWRPNRRVELLFVRATALPCAPAEPVTLKLPPPGLQWCLPAGGDPNHRCCFVTSAGDGGNAWPVQPAEAGTIQVNGSIKHEDGSPGVNLRFVLTAPDGEYMDGEVPGGPGHGQPIPGVTAADGSFYYAGKPKGIGVYTVSVQEAFVARNAGEPAAAATGNAVFKHLDGTSPFDVIVVP